MAKAMITSLRLHFWLRVMDFAYWSTGFGSPFYFWSIRKAAACIEYDLAESGSSDGEAPF